MKKSCLVVMVLVCACAFAQGPFTLVYKPEVGKTYTYAVESQQTLTQEMGGQEMVNESQAMNKIALTPQSVTENGDFVLIAQYVEKITKIKNFRMDTTFVEEDQCGKKIELQLTALGETLAVTEIDSFPRGRGMMRMVNLDPKIAFRHFFRELPETPVNVGDTWTKARTDTVEVMRMNLIVTAEVDYNLVAEEEKLGFQCLKITFTGPITIEGQGSQGGNDFFMEGSGKAEGTCYFAPAEGLLIADDVLTDQEMTIAITGQNNMTIPQTTSTHATMTLVP
ncbi:hypothetical protein JXO59_15315 [candidate division KSB1 bacterium]|nr:hypothetical protein [candidate division KSB1 bacterium]